MIYIVKATKRYRKSLKKMIKAGKDIQKLQEVINHLSTKNSLPSKYKDHPLKGSLKGKRECHIDPNWLLLYEKREKKLVLILISTGTHNDVLGIE